MRIGCFHNFLIQKRGAELAFMNMVIGLSKKGNEVEVYSFFINDYFKEEFQKRGIKYNSFNFKKPIVKNRIFFLHPFFFFKDFLIVKKNLNKIADEINSKNYDIIFVSHWEYSVMLFPILKKPIAYYCHEPPRHVYEDVLSTSENNQENFKIKIQKILDKIYFLPKFVVKYVDKECVKYAKVIFANSNYSKEVIEKIYKKKTIVIYLGVDANLFSPLKINKENYILSVGAIYPLKGHDIVIEALGLIPKEKRPRLIIIGNEIMRNYREFIINLAKKNDVKLEIKSEINTEELILLYNKALTTVCAYKKEPFGLVSLESMSCGTIVIGANEGGLGETIKEPHGILVNRDKKEIVDAILWVLDNPKKANEIGKLAREFVINNFTWEKCFDNLNKNLKGLI